MNAPHVLDLILEPNDARRLASLCGPFDEHLRQIESRLGVLIRSRGNRFCIEGPVEPSATARRVLNALYDETLRNPDLSAEQVHLQLHDGPDADAESTTDSSTSVPGQIRTRRSTIRPRGRNQLRYVRAMQDNDINFGIGPAGTGKTYLAVACAVEALDTDRARRIVLVRPAVEAGEKLGFLPGDLAQKIDPYLRPLYDALYEMLGFDTVHKLIERSVIEVAPLAYMRGRTLNNAFIILDEGQNTTSEQMKMFLTRIGHSSRAVITGDVTQIDLPRGVTSGIKQALHILQDVEGIGITRFKPFDVVRHPLVQSIVEAYEEHESSNDQTDDWRSGS